MNCFPMDAAFFVRNFDREPTWRAEAPGRLEFIGNHTDYNGGQVMGVTIDRAVRVAIAPRDDAAVCLLSEGQTTPVSVTLENSKPL